MISKRMVSHLLTYSLIVAQMHEDRQREGWGGDGWEEK